jgi:tetratricopeptide (TPR) repeat protein
MLFYFQNDGHWNEEGNKLVAVYIFKFLLEKLKLGPQEDLIIKKGLYEYFSAFSPIQVSNSWLDKTPVSTQIKQIIFLKYLELQPFPPKFYEQFFNTDVKPATYYFLKANGFYSQGDYARAIQNYNKGISLEPSNIDAYNNRGISYVNI